MRSYFGLILAFIGAVASAQSVTWSPVPANFPLTISNPTTGQCVTYNGTVWVNGSCGTASAVPASGVQAGTLGSGVLLNSASTQTLGQTTIFASDVNPSNSGATNVTNMAAHVTACVAAGGCVIQLGCYSSPIPMANSVAPAIVLGVENATAGGQDTPYVGVSLKGCGWSINSNTNRPIGTQSSGTVFQGTSTSYPILAYNYVDGTAVYSTAANGTFSYLTTQVQDIAFDTCSTCVQFGALGKMGLYNSVIKNVFASNFKNWGFWFENFQYNVFDGLQAQVPASGCVGGGPISETANCGMIAFVASIASATASVFCPGIQSAQLGS